MFIQYTTTPNGIFNVVAFGNKEGPHEKLACLRRPHHQRGFCRPRRRLDRKETQTLIGRAIGFCSPGILFVGDSAAASLIAIDTGDSKANKGAGSIELKGINQKIAAALGAAPEQITIQDLAVNPVSRNI